MTYPLTTVDCYCVRIPLPIENQYTINHVLTNTVPGYKVSVESLHAVFPLSLANLVVLHTTSVSTSTIALSASATIFSSSIDGSTSSSSLGLSLSMDSKILGISTSTKQGLSFGMGKTNVMGTNDYTGKTAGLDDSLESVSPSPSSSSSSSRCKMDDDHDHGGSPMESFRTKSATAKFARTTGVNEE